jgi:hypothetical protein
MLAMKKLTKLSWGSLFFCVWFIVGAVVFFSEFRAGQSDKGLVAGFFAAVAAFYGHRFVTSMRAKATSQANRKSQIILTVTPTRIAIQSPNGEYKAIDWAKLIRVDLVTTHEGPFVDDVFWGLYCDNGDVLAYPNSATGTKDLLQAMQQRLDGFNNIRLVKAMGSTANAKFTLWEKTALT